MNTLQVHTKPHTYNIYIDENLDIDSYINTHIANKQVFIVTNETVAALYLEKIINICSSASLVSNIQLPDGEKYKNLDTYKIILDKLMSDNFNRDSVLIALGGGVVGDITGFAAATFQRGVQFIQIPTTLLSQVDSSVGGKTGVNHSLGKNMIGAFKQPEAVFIDLSVLKTLPTREVSAGIAEIIKYSLINDYEFFCWLEKNIEKLLKLDSEVTSYAVYKSCEHKSIIVAEDEFESGKRALLNLGHTYGHVIENYMGYGKWLHGEAVAVGMLQAAHTSHLHGWLSENDVKRIKALLKKANLPVEPPNISLDASLSLMGRDKKVKSGNIRLVLMKKIGQAFITNQFDMSFLEKTLTTNSY